MIIDYQVIDNFLPKDLFTQIKENVVDNEGFPWYHTRYISTANTPSNTEHSYFCHGVFKDNKVHSELFQILELVLHRLPNFNVLQRIKINFYIPCPIVEDHEKHRDLKIPHQSAILSLNTCNGYTRLHDGTKVDSVANRLLLFDGSKLHNSTSTSDYGLPKGRFNINFNYFPKNLIYQPRT